MKPVFKKCCQWKSLSFCFKYDKIKKMNRGNNKHFIFFYVPFLDFLIFISLLNLYLTFNWFLRHFHSFYLSLLGLSFIFLAFFLISFFGVRRHLPYLFVYYLFYLKNNNNQKSNSYDLALMENERSLSLCQFPSDIFCNHPIFTSVSCSWHSLLLHSSFLMVISYLPFLCRSRPQVFYFSFRS